MNNQINLIPRPDATTTRSVEQFATIRFVGIIVMTFVVFCSLVLFLLVNFYTVLALVPSDITVNSFELKDKDVTISLTGGSLSSLDAVLKRIQDTVTAKKIGKASMESLTQTSTSNSFTMSLSLHLL
jgi:hypothetical protein